MNHEEAIDLVHAGRDGPLEEQTRTELEAHLAGCEHCRGIAATYGTIYEVLREEATHLATDEIVAYATDRKARTPDECERVETHTATCTICQDEIARVERVHRSVKADPGEHVRSRPQKRQRWIAGPWLAAAATLVTALLLYPAYLGVYRLPSVARQAETAAAELESFRGWSGAADLELITSGLRDASDVPVIEIEREQPFVLLGVQVAVTGDLIDEALVRFEVLDSTRETVAITELTAGDVRERIRSAGVVAWLVPAGGLETGKYTIRALAPDGTELIRVPAIVRTSHPR